MERYITLSIDLHLFFARIMKEHALFLKVGFPLKDKSWIDEAEWYKSQFEELLFNIVRASNGVVSPNVLNAGEIVTEFTANAEKQTAFLSGININGQITELERNLQPRSTLMPPTVTVNDVQRFNNQSLKLVDGLITFKERLLDEILRCKIFNANYPLLIDHILREARLYRSYIIELEQTHNIAPKSIKETELFWNRIMMEHALFIRGLLDPTEVDLINTANNFAQEYQQLLTTAQSATDATIQQATNITLQETIKYRDFKVAGAQGLLECKIRSIILPLLADHVLREANHYLRILREISNQ
jgi:hypothetical protein